MEFITSELTKKLKEKGFDYKRVSLYDWHKCINTNYATPTISQALKWLRDTYKLFLSPCVIADYQDDFHPDITYWSFIVVNIESGDYVYREYEHIDDKRFSSYEEAALHVIEYVLDNNLI